MNDYSQAYLDLKKAQDAYYKYTLTHNWEKAITMAENICDCAEALLLQTLAHVDKDYIKKPDVQE
jgi:hypothetical protein